MPANYNRLWKLLIDRRMTKTQMRLAAGLSTVTLARMNKGGRILDSTLDRICDALKCSRSDIMADGERGGKPLNREG